MNRSAVSLFSGAGGMDLGFEAAGWDVVFANDVDAHAVETHRANFACGALLGDVRSHGKAVSSCEGAAIVFGGPPCQGFSVAGKRDLSDPRSELVFSFFDVVERVRPMGFAMENVKALAALGRFAPVRQALEHRARSLGFQTHWVVLNAADHGVAQSRERVFFMGVRGLPADWPWEERFSSRRQARVPSRGVFQSLGPQGTQGNPITCEAKITLAVKPVLRASPYAGMLFNGAGRPVSPDAPIATLPASMGGNRTPIVDEDHVFQGAPSWVEAYHAHLQAGGQPWPSDRVGAGLRRLTLREAAAFHSFPSSHVFAGPLSAQYRQIGNAVPPLLAQVVAEVLQEAVDCL